MRFAVVAAAAAAFGVASAASNGTAPVYVTDIVTAYTTYCPEATLLTNNGMTYTVSEATTLTITNCPGGCTITKPVSASTAAPVEATSTGVEVAPVPYPSATGVSVAPVATSASAGYAAPMASNGTIPATGTGSPVTSATGTSSPISSFTGAANKAYSAAGAGVLAIFGLVAVL